MDNRNFVWLMGVILFISGCTMGIQEPEIVGDSVLIDDDDLYLKVTPHTLTSSGWVETEFQSKTYSGEIDFAFGFDTDTARPTQAEIYNPKTVNETKVYDCQYEFAYTLNPNYFWCYSSDNATGNITHFEHWFDNGSVVDSVAQWHKNYTKNWHNWRPDNVIDYDYADMNKWYYSKNQNVNSGQTYKLRYYLDVPFNPAGTEGKYTLALKPSSKTFAQAIADNQFFMLDPWWNTSYRYRYNLSINISGELAEYSDPIIEVSINNFNGSWDSLEVVHHDGAVDRVLDWEWASHDISEIGNATKAIRFVASNQTFTNATLHNNFSLYLPDTTTTPTNDSIFWLAEDFEDGDSNGWSLDADISFNFQDDGWVNISNNGATIKNATFNLQEEIDDTEVYAGFKSRLTVGDADQSFYVNLGEQYTQSIYMGIGPSNYRLYDGSFYNILESANNVSNQANISAYGTDLIYNYTAREETTLTNNTRANTGDFNSADTINMWQMTFADFDNPSGIVVDDLYLGKIPFNLYFANTTVNLTVGEESINAPTINSIAFTPTSANTSYTGPFNCSSELVFDLDSDDYNITMAWYRNSVIESAYSSTTNQVDLASAVVINATNYTGTIADDDTLYCKIDAISYAGLADNATSTSSTITITGSVPTGGSASPDRGTFVSAEDGVTLSCSGVTDADGDTINYEIYNQSSLMQNTTSTTFTIDYFDNVPTMYNYSCRPVDDDGVGDWIVQNNTYTSSILTHQNDTYNTPFINFSYRDEITNAIMNASITSAEFNYTNSGTTLSYSYSNSTAANYTPLAYAPDNSTITLNAVIDYKSSGYSQRHYENSWTLTNTTTQQTLYLLSDDDGSYSTFTVTSVNSVPLDDVNVVVTTTINSVSTTVAQGSTGDDGSITFFLDPNKAHTFVFSKSGYASVTRTLTPTQPSYVVTMGSSATGNYSTNITLQGVDWSYGPPLLSLTPGTSYIFTFNITANLNNLASCKFNLSNQAGQTLANASGCDYPDGGNNGTINLTYNMNVSRVYGSYYIKLSNQSTSWITLERDAIWTDLTDNQTLSNTTTVKSFFNRLRNINGSYFHYNQGGDEQKALWSATAFFFLMLALILGLFTYMTGFEIRNPGTFMLIVTFLIAIASNQGFFELAATDLYKNSLSDFYDRYWLALLSLGVTIGIILNNFRREQL